MKYNYKFLPVNPNEVVQQDNYSSADKELLKEFQVNNNFDQVSDFIELHYYSLDGRLLNSVEDYTNIKSPQDSETAEDGRLSSIELGTVDDIVTHDYEAGDVYLYYNFLSDPYTENKSSISFFIEQISPDRTEIRLLTTELNDKEISEYTEVFKDRISESDFEGFYLNLKHNRFLLATNINFLAYEDFTSVVIKLYNPLPEDIGIKNKLTINEIVSDSVAYKVEAEAILAPVKKEYLKGPNFNIDEGRTSSSPTQYLNIDEVFNYPVTNSYYEVRSLFDEKGASLSIDNTDYSNFINFSSAEERLANFKYKLDLIQSYQVSKKSKENINSYSTSSTDYYDGLINSILSNFDHYDRYLYYESGSYSWPKTNSVRPFILDTSSATGSWYSTQTISASNYDSTNPNQLINSIPEFLREDSNNSKYVTFVHMVAQHFDNLWIYAQSVTDKYDSDNRLNKGISKDLIEDALKNFGLKLYNSNRSSQELFSMFTGESYSTGSESFVNEIITGSNDITSQENYRKQIYKRLYHNLPLLLKGKGTERGVRALLSTFGIPSLYSSGSHSGIHILQQGGSVSGSYNLGGLQYLSSSLGKIKLDNTGSIEGKTLSKYVSINIQDEKYSKDLNNVQIGYSPSDFLNNEYIIPSASSNNFDIDSILGDPDMAYSSSYVDLNKKAEEYLAPTFAAYATGSSQKDFTRILKYFDNILFKTVVDFLPGRVNTNTGIIIKPHLLERAKAKQVKPTHERHNEFSQSINTQTITGSTGATFGGRDQYTSSYTEFYITSGGLAASSLHSHEQAKYDGEFSGSKLTLSNGEFNIENNFKYVSAIENIVDIAYLTSSAPVPTPTPTPTSTVTPTPTPTTEPPVSATPTPTPTNTPTPSNAGTVNIKIRVYAEIGVDENNSNIEYKVTASPSSSPSSPSVTTGDLGSGFINLDLNNVSGNDNVVVNVLRVAPDASATAIGGIQWDGFDPAHISINVTGDTFGNSDEVNFNYTLSNFDTSLSLIPINVNITEG